MKHREDDKKKCVPKSLEYKYPENIKDMSSRTTRKILTRLNLKCCVCGWNDGSCDIHHINGRKIKDCDNHDNLTYICPNCHRLVHENKIDQDVLIPLSEYLPTNWKDFYYVYEVPKETFCPICGGFKNEKSVTCSRSCANINRYKININKTELKNMLQKGMSYNDISKKLKISKSTISRKTKEMDLQKYYCYNIKTI